MDSSGTLSIRKRTFADIEVGDGFAFPGKDKTYKKVTEEKRPYTPEPYSNAVFKWTSGNPGNESSGYTFFYVSPSTEVV